MAAALAVQRRSLIQAGFHFLKWGAPLLPVYVLAAAGAAALAAAASGSSEAGAGYGALIGLTSALPAVAGLWLLNTVVAWLFRRSLGETWVRWVFWGFGLAAGLMPLLAFLSNNALSGLSGAASLSGLGANQQAEVVALAETVRLTVIALALTLFALALITSWWNWRAAGAWQRKRS